MKRPGDGPAVDAGSDPVLLKATNEVHFTSTSSGGYFVGEISSIRPRLRQDSTFLPIENGVFLRNENGALTLKGGTIYQVLSALAPRLNGEQTLEELCAGLDPPRKETVYRL